MSLQIVNDGFFCVWALTLIYSYLKRLPRRKTPRNDIKLVFWFRLLQKGSNLKNKKMSLQIVNDGFFCVLALTLI